MPFRRAVLATGTVTLAGCSDLEALEPGEQTPNPADHVPDEWHDEPRPGLADPIERSREFDGDEDVLGPKAGCPYAAARTVHDVIDDRLGDPQNVAGGGCCRETDDGERTVIVERLIHVGRSGTVVSSPSVEFRTVREATPRYVDMTVSLGDVEHACRVPVYVRDVMMQMD